MQFHCIVLGQFCVCTTISVQTTPNTEPRTELPRKLIHCPQSCLTLGFSRYIRFGSVQFLVLITIQIKHIDKFCTFLIECLAVRLYPSLCLAPHSFCISCKVHLFGCKWETWWCLILNQNGQHCAVLFCSQLYFRQSNTRLTRPLCVFNCKSTVPS